MADLSKIKLGDVTYNLKDATARANMTTLLGGHALEALGDAAWKGLVASIGAEMVGANLPTADAVKNYVDSQIELIPEFDVVVVQTLPEASEDTFHKIYLVNASGTAQQNVYKEYITLRSGAAGSYTYSWELLGDTAIDLSGYVQKTQLIAGIDLQDNITADELKTALGLKAMAYAATASGTGSVQTIDSITMDSVTVAGNAAVTHTSANATLTKGNYTPAGSVAVTLNNNGVLASVDNAGQVPSFTEGAFTPNTPTVVDVTKFNAGALPSKAADTFSFTANTPAEVDVTKFSGGSLGNASTGNFATAGLVGEVGTGTDAETLILTAASTSAAVTAQGTFTPAEIQSGFFTEGSAASASFTEGAFTQGSLPSLGTGFYTAGVAASKAADTFNAGSMPTFNEGTVGVQSATFSGTEAENIIVTGVAYDKADATAAFSETVTPTVASYSRTAKDVDVTVTPDAE